MRAHHLSVGFDAPLVRDLSFGCEPGSVSAIVGTNAVGKTTLMRTLAGITAPLAGSVSVGGQDVHAMKPKARAKRMSLIAQEDQPPGDLSVRELVMLGRIPHMRPFEFSGERHAAVVEQHIARCELQHYADTPCAELSGGLRRRALIARGFAQETEVLLLDEPTNHLDIYHQLRLLQLLKSCGKTVVLSMHDLDLAVGYADQLVLIEPDRVTVGEPQAVLSPAVVERAFAVRSQIVQGMARKHLLLEHLDERNDL